MADASENAAEAQLGRILFILAAARGHDGIPLAELAARLGVSPQTIRNDVAEVTGREFYHPAASVMEMTILLERERISVPVAGEFRRPMRLTPREAGALGLALRARAAEAALGQRDELLELAVALENALTAPPARTHQGPGEDGRPSLARAVEIDPGDGAQPGVRLLLEDAITRRSPVRMRYLKPGDAAPADRSIHPYALVTSEGEWYVLAFSPERGEVREFRLDRILSAELAEGHFEVPADFDPATHTPSGRPYVAADDREVAVRYSARVARWVVERWDGEPGDDGSVVVRHRVADRRWLVRLVLGFGGEAAVLGPEEMRRAVRDAAEGLVEEYAA